MIPGFDARGLLPPRVHQATRQAFVERFATNECRKALVSGFYEALSLLRECGCRWVYVGGSLLSTKECPNDFDARFELDNRWWARLDADLHPLSITSWQGTERQLQRFGGELFLQHRNVHAAGTELTYKDYFQMDKVTWEARGVVLLDLWSLP